MNDLEHDSLYSDWPKSVTEVSSVCSSLYMLTLGARISLYQPLLTLCRCTHQPLSAFVDTLLVHVSAFSELKKGLRLSVYSKFKNSIIREDKTKEIHV